ncbi:MAG: hypothetical protein IPM27_11575 [Nitrosomonadales bacterium]|nr:hypothetical protein [Nitrosomonadales bacterium]
MNNLLARVSGARSIISGEMDDIQSLDSMPLFLLGVGLISPHPRHAVSRLLATPDDHQHRADGVQWRAFEPAAPGQPGRLYISPGVIVLVGIAVNSAIKLIDAANQRRDGTTPSTRRSAARRRVVPILITTTTTTRRLSLALRLAEILIWGPVASFIVFGRSISTVLTLFSHAAVMSCCETASAFVNNLTGVPWLHNLAHSCHQIVQRPRCFRLVGTYTCFKTNFYPSNGGTMLENLRCPALKPTVVFSTTIASVCEWGNVAPARPAVFAGVHR